MTTAAPITALTVITDVDELTQTAATYAAMTDELAGMVEDSPQAHTISGTVTAHRLAALHVALDELTVITPSYGYLARLVVEVDELRRFLMDEAHELFAWLAVPLDELYAAVVRQARAIEGRA